MTIEWTQLFAAPALFPLLFLPRVPKLLPNLSPSPARVIDIYFVSYAALPFIPSDSHRSPEKKTIPVRAFVLKRKPQLDFTRLRVAPVSFLNRSSQDFRSIEYRFLDCTICGSASCIRRFVVRLSRMKFLCIDLSCRFSI